MPDATKVIEGLCDSCGAKSYVEYSLDGKPLTFCAHHGTEYSKRLTAMGAKVEADNREKVGQ
jgi:hypothetical protein